MYLFYNSRIHVITLYSGHVCVYYASMLQCWHLVRILVRTDHPCLGVVCHRFGIPQTLTMDQGLSFMSHQAREFAESLKIKLLSSSLYYAQAKSSNKTLIKLIKKKIEKKPKRWHEALSEAL
jgi:hypothetical protein